ncbi:MAG TPA: sugar phosphate isomerase/epimerase [bacterium]|nr:sugar phosphate isomerase/epimerase [bacterium]HQL61349.1 sugar phosphate isomerase/epimerase [bacterium]
MMSLFTGCRVPSLFLGSLMLSFAFPSGAFAQSMFPPECCIGGIALGPQAYSFNRFTFFEAIDKAKQMGCNVIEAYPGQALCPDEKGVQFSHDAPPSVWSKALRKLNKTGVRLVAYGVVGLGKDEESNRKVFDFAKLMGISVITTEPDDIPEGSLDVIEKLVQEYNIKIAIHNHPKSTDNPKYKFWDPNYVLECVKRRDPRMGACADTGHWARSGVNPIEALKILEGRVISAHLKDLNEFGNREAHDVPWGTGVCDMGAILDELLRQHFSGPASMEYEYNWDNSVPDMIKCVEFAREHGK